MSLLILDFGYRSLELTEIGVFTKDELCVGAALFEPHSSICNPRSAIGLAVWGDDPSTEAVDGALPGESLTFRIWTGELETTVEFTPVEGAAVYEPDGLLIGALEAPAAIPIRFEVAGAFPNPFNSATCVAFGLPEPGEVSIEITDIRGRRVAEATLPHCNAGNVKWFWSARDDAGAPLPSGVYIGKVVYRPGAGASVEARFKVSLLK